MLTRFVFDLIEGSLITASVYVPVALAAALAAQRRYGVAGEHTSAWHGWMNGALESGNRAAAEVNDAESAAVLEVRASD